jgi:hypothetical protein
MNLRMRNCQLKTARKSQRGFALMMVMFLTTLLLISVMVAAPYIRTERQREKEEEMIWRGKQYVRGIKLYYRKTGRFPTSMDDLTKPKLGSIRFMRQAYKDPMNKEDGSWRMIYLGPAGQLVGSLKPPQTLQLPGQLGTPVGANVQQRTGFGSSGFGQSSQPTVQTGGAQPGQPGTGQNPAGAQGSNNTGVSSDTGTDNGGGGLISTDTPLLGGNIIGVGSKINRRSVIVYDKAKNYRLFEFIWNPSKDLANALNQQIGAPGQNPQGPGQGQPGFGQTGFGQTGVGQTGFGSQNNTPANPQPTQPTTDMPLPTPPPTPVTPPPQ